MIRVTVQKDRVLVKIYGKDFWDDLARVHSDFPQTERVYDDGGKFFVIANPEKFRHVSYIRTALDDYKKQMIMF